MKFFSSPPSEFEFVALCECFFLPFFVDDDIGSLREFLLVLNAVCVCESKLFKIFSANLNK